MARDGELSLAHAAAPPRGGGSASARGMMGGVQAARIAPAESDAEPARLTPRTEAMLEAVRREGAALRGVADRACVDGGGGEGEGN